MVTFVVAKDGTALMPTSNIKKIRKLLKNGRAEIYKYRPFTIRLLYDSTTHTQPMELCVDTGRKHIGVSIKSEKHEYVSAEFLPLNDEKVRHEHRSSYRRTRRNHLRYRKERRNNRKREEGWIAPSLKHIKDCHVSIVDKYIKVCPVKNIYVEMATFDTQKIAAIEKGLPVPVGLDYCHGPRYGIDTLRKAVFFRDEYICQCCKKSAFTENLKLHVHHIYYWRNDHSDRMDNLITVCEKCHNSTNHKEGGKLYGWKPKLKSLSGAAFMNSLRRTIYNDIKELGIETKQTFGTITNIIRRARRISKSHNNDAYCIGYFHPKHRVKFTKVKKLRRNSRILEEFVDAQYIDSRDGKKKSGKELGCNRTKRDIPRDNPNNLRVYRQKKVSKGKRRIRRQRYDIRPYDKIMHKGAKYAVKSIQNCGACLSLYDIPKEIKPQYPSVNRINFLYHANGWARV